MLGAGRRETHFILASFCGINETAAGIGFSNLMSHEREVIELDSAFEAPRQGDVLRWEKTDRSPWTEHAIVVTADCDLEFNKNRNSISYVPLVRFDTYVGCFWGPDYVAKKAEKIFEGATAAIRRAHKAKGLSGDLNYHVVRDWIVRDSAGAIVEMLSHESLSPAERRTLEVVIDKAKRALGCEHDLMNYDTDGDTYVRRIIVRANDLLPESRGDPAKSVLEALQGHCRSLPGDVFFVSTVPGDGDGGYFALLRHIGQCDINDVSLDPVRRAGPVLPLRRIARLTSPYVYALTQQLAKVFADIGLPKEYVGGLTSCIDKYLASGEGK
jgi:hypothetical protein